MTRRDFQLIAGTLNRVHAATALFGSKGQRETVEVVAEKLADVLAGTNPKFDRARFLSASGVHANKGDQ